MEARKETDAIDYLKGVRDGYKKGIKEVLEFKCDECSTPGFLHLVIPVKKLKEVGDMLDNLETARMALMEGNMDKQPSEQENLEFWEWCGFKRLPLGREGFHFEQTVKTMNWMPPDATKIFQSINYLPRIDLNNLFRWAVPKLARWEMGSRQDGLTYGIVSGEQLHPSEAFKKDPALALFWAIYQVIKEENK